MVSLVLTTRDEERTIGLLLEDVMKQTRIPDELVIVDGGSRDRTVEIIRGYEERFAAAGVHLVLRRVPGANIAQGRNEAIRVAQGPYIAVTDAGCRLDPRWLERIIEPLVAKRADFVGGFFRPVARTRFQRVLAGLTTAPHPTRRFLPSSRSVAFTKALWERVGGYPEWLPWGEDTLYNQLCLKAGARYEVITDALVYWEVRPTFRAALRQYFRYAFGDGLAARFSRSHLLVQGVFWGSFLASITLSPWALAPIFLCPLAWVLYRRAASIRDLPLAYVTALGLHAARFAGFVWGVSARALRRGRHT